MDRKGLKLGIVLQTVKKRWFLKGHNRRLLEIFERQDRIEDPRSSYVSTALLIETENIYFELRKKQRLF